MRSFANTSASERPIPIAGPARPTVRPTRTAPGCAEIGVTGRGGRSLVTRAFATSPLRVLTPANHGRAAWIYTSTFGGGLVDGDRFAIDVAVGGGASALLSTQASTKVYRSPRGIDVHLHARIEDDGWLVAVPDPVVCFAASRYRQHQRVDLAEGGNLVLLDWVTSGRRATGERWVFDEYVSRTVVYHGGRLLLHDALALRAVDGNLGERMGRFDVLAVVVIAGPALRDEAAALVSEVDGLRLARRADDLTAATALPGGGCVVRLAGCSTEQVGRRIRRLLSFVPRRLGDDPWARKW